jgi:RNA polymerase sigma-70 factor (sigma-E family)
MQRSSGRWRCDRCRADGEGHLVTDPSFEEFVAARGHALVRTAYLLCGDHALAEDLVQAAFGKAYVHWARIAAMDSPEAYVRRMIVNQHVSWWRRRRVRDEPRAALPDVGLADIAEAHAAKALVRAAIRSLPARQRTAIVLRYFEDLSDHEIALALDCSDSTVRSQISRALASIRASGALRDLIDNGSH